MSTALVFLTLAAVAILVFKLVKPSASYARALVFRCRCFAAYLNISLASYNRYERDHVPDPAPLLRFMAFAQDRGWEELRAVIRAALLKGLEITVNDYSHLVGLTGWTIDITLTTNGDGDE